MFKGILPPLTTPFINDEIAYDKLKDNLRYLNKTDLRGYVLLGSNGESAYLSWKEKLTLIEVARENIPDDKILIVGSGLESLKMTLSLTNDAARQHADAALIVTPSFFKNAMTRETLGDYYRRIAESARIPLLIYNVPKFTGINIDPETVAKLAEHPNIVGIKNSSENIAHLAEIIHLTPANFMVLVGTASVLYPGLCVGAEGGIVALANIAPDACVRIQSDVIQERHKEALSLQMRLLAVNKAVTTTYGVSGLKAAMDILGYFGGQPRAPLKPLNDSQREHLKAILKEAGFLAD